MRGALLSIAAKLGIDKSIAYSSGARVIQALVSVGSIFFFSAFLTGVEQGFYFTFGSIVAIQIFFELGLTNIITQYVAHEDSFLHVEHEQIIGDDGHKSRLAYLLHFCVKWYLVIAALFFFSLVIVGFIFFSRYSKEHTNVSWRIPWLLICAGSAIKLFQAPFNSFIEGLGYVTEMSRVSFWQQIIIPTSTWLGLFLSFKLYVVGISTLLSVLVWFIYVRHSFLWELLQNLWKTNVTEWISYMQEIFPYQWKIAISWISGYFIFQLFNPVLFATEGAVVAGQMGMTLNALNSITGFSLSWITTKIPFMSKLIAQKDYVALDNIFNRTVRQMMLVCLALLVTFFIFLWFLNLTGLSFRGNVIAHRFLGYLPTVLLAVTIIFGVLVNAWATYLRCHKKEPWLLNSVCTGILTMLSTFGLGKYFGLYGVVGGYFSVQCLMFPWGVWIFKTKKKEWHGE